MVVGWTWHRNVYVPALSASTDAFSSLGPVVIDVTPPTTFPLESWMTTLCGAVESWSSNSSVNAVSALAWSVFSAKPDAAAPFGAVTLTTGALGLADAGGPPPAPGAPLEPGAPLAPAFSASR